MKYWRGYLTAGILALITVGLMLIAERFSQLVDMVYPYVTREVQTILAGWSSTVGFTLWQVLVVAMVLAVVVTLVLAITLKKSIVQWLGWVLMANFRQPYFATSIADFWRRWHVSLSSWFRDYLYIPLGGSRVSAVRNWMNLMITFLVSGAWHGASWHFILWGGLHGAYQVAGKWKNSLLNRIRIVLGIEKEIHLPKLLQMAVTFALVVFAWMLFRVNSLRDLKEMLLIVVNQPFVKDFAAMNMSKVEWVLLLISLTILMLVDILQSKNISVNRLIVNCPAVVRVLFYTAGIGSIVIFGVYGVAYDASQFLYFQF